MPAPRRRARLWTRLLFVGAATLVLLEGVLQIGSVVVWMGQRGRSESAETADGYTILCVGDSWTHGIGSLDLANGSYPARLERLLRRRIDDRWRVVNGGQSGQNSREVLERLPGQIERARPSWVLVLVGQNDFWSKPERLELEPGEVPMDPGAFRWRFRTGRLLAWAMGKWTGAGQAGGSEVGEPPPWALGGQEWQPRSIAREGPALPDRDWARDPRTREGLGQYRKALAADRLGEARAALEAVFARRQDDPRVLGSLAIQRRKAGDHDGARELLAVLRSGWQRERDDWWAEAYSRALVDVAERADANAELGRLSAARPADGELMARWAGVRFLCDEVAESRELVERAWESCRSPNVAQTRYLLWRADRGRRTADSLVDYYVLSNDGELFADRMRGILLRDIEERQTFLDSIAEADCDADRRQRMTATVDWVVAELDGGGASETGRTLAHHLEQIRAVVEGAGARCVFLTYPLPNRGDAELREVAADHEITFLPVADHYPIGDWERLRAPDGHCNDDGYALFTAMVGVWLAPRLGAPAEDPLVGLWSCAEPQLALLLARDGTGYLGAEPLRWRARDGALALSLDNGTELAFRFERAEHLLNVEQAPGVTLDFERVR